jgi:hypothetical protein
MMTARTTTRIAAAGLLAAAAVLTTSSAQALPGQHPDPQTVIRPAQDLRETVRQLLDEGRQAATVAERRLTHHDLVQSVLDGE